MSRAGSAASAVIWATVLWLALGQLIFVGDVGSQPAFSAPRMLAYLLLVVAPVVTFVPLARWMDAPLYDLEGIAGWGLLGFTVAFIRPDSPPTLAQFLFFLVPLTFALATLVTPLAWLVALHQRRGVRLRRDVIRARRQGYLVAFFLVALMLLHGIGTLSPTSMVLLAAIVVLAETLAVTVSGRPVGIRDGGVR